MSQDKQLQAELETVRIPLMGEMKGVKSNSGYSNFCDYYNCWPEIYRHPSTGEESSMLTRLPVPNSSGDYGDMPAALVASLGLTSTNLSAVAHMAMSQMSNIMIAVWIDKSTGTMYIMQHSVASTTVVHIGTIALLGAISVANSLYDTVSIYEGQIANAGTIYAGITVVRTAFDRSLSKSYFARATSTTTFTAATLTQIVDVDFPDQLGTPLCVTGPIIQMNGIFHALTTSGVIYSSGGTSGTANDPVNWTSTAVILTYQDPDAAVTLARYKHHLLVFGSNSVEFFNDEGIPAPASPLARTEQAAVRFGTISPRTVINVADTIYWISSGRSNTIGLWRMDGYEPMKISTPREDVKISGSRGTGSGYALDTINLACLSIAGKVHIVMNGVTTYPISRYLYGADVLGGTGGSYTNDTSATQAYHAISLASGAIVYNTADKIWWNLMTWVDDNLDGAATGYGNIMGILPVTPYLSPSLSPEYSDISVMLFPRISPANTSTSTRLAQVAVIKNPGPAWGGWADLTNFSAAFPMIVQFNPLDFGNSKRKRIHKAELVCGKALHTGSSGLEMVTLAYMRNPQPRPNQQEERYYNWVKRYMDIPAWGGGTPRTYTSPDEPLGLQAGLRDRLYVNNLGIGRTWQFNILYGGVLDMPIEYLELTVSQCTS